MEVDYSKMTVEEYLKAKAEFVEKAILSHCEQMANHITREYENARSRELNDMESKNQNKGELNICLTCLEGPHEGQKFPLIVKSKTYPWVGRLLKEAIVKNGVCLSKDREVSSYHGKFLLRGGTLRYKDNESTNYSYINNNLVTKEVTVIDGDILKVGQSVLKISIV